MLRHDSQVLSDKNYRNITFFVMTGVLVLFRDDVTTEVSLSRQRRSQIDVMYYNFQVMTGLVLAGDF